MKKLCVLILLGAFASVGAQAADLKKPLVKDGKTYTYQEGMPYVERGELKNAQPVYKREPTPAEKVVQKVVDSPVRPTIVDKKPAVQYNKTFP